MKEIALAVLWHLHQPYYTDRVTGTAPFPWVRLHATKGYFDMAVLLEEYPEMRATVNLTPSLLLQLQEQQHGTVTDLFFRHATRPAADLTHDERAFILRHFFAANWDTMIRPHDRYYGLLIQRGLTLSEEELARLVLRFSVQELLDLQVWHNLAWFGHAALQRIPALRELIAKGRQFSESEKQTVLAAQREVLTRLVPLYRQLQDRGQIELSTTPFYHPILPLVIDTDIARRARPDCALPARFAHPEDAEAQLAKAVAFHESLFGRRPIGLWPSEGSVCPELMPMLARLGFEWAATDEGILAQSIDDWEPEESRYRAYRAPGQGNEPALLFRDRELSDLIGFTYAKNAAVHSVEDFCGRLQKIGAGTSDARPLVSVILDGENPWESYPDGGEGFLRGLYTALTQRNGGDHGFRTVTPAKELKDYPPATQLTRLHSGSWINSDFKIWLGHAEDNDAWERVGKTRRFLQRQEQEKKVSADALRAAWEELYAAEGSDWFWWYGDDFETDTKPLFDHLFRLHLSNVYRLLGAEVPEFLHMPVLRERAADTVIREPMALIRPMIDGVVTDFFEWRGAGYLECRAPLSSMHKGPESFSRIYFGCDLNAFYLRFDPVEGGHNGAKAEQATPSTGSALAEVHVVFIAPHQMKLVFRLDDPSVRQFSLLKNADTSLTVSGRSFDSICRKKIIELAVPLKELGLDPGMRAQWVVKVVRDGIELEQFPRYQPLVLAVPDHTFEATMWRV